MKSTIKLLALCTIVKDVISNTPPCSADLIQQLEDKHIALNNCELAKQINAKEYVKCLTELDQVDSDLSDCGINPATIISKLEYIELICGGIIGILISVLACFACCLDRPHRRIDQQNQHVEDGGEVQRNVLGYQVEDQSTTDTTF
jgi:hypothetical protein